MSDVMGLKPSRKVQLLPSQSMGCFPKGLGNHEDVFWVQGETSLCVANSAIFEPF